MLVVHPNSTTNNQLRQTLKLLGFAQISGAPSHVVGLEREQERRFTHVFFDAKGSDMPALEFVQKSFELDEATVLVAVSLEPKVDDVFGLLSAGATGFLVVPFTTDGVEEVLTQASDGPPLGETVLNTPDRNTALTGVVLNSLYRVSALIRQAREFPSAARELERAKQSLRTAVEMARLFSEGGDERLVEQFVEGCIARSNTASTRLGRTRKRLRQRRDGDSPKVESATNYQILQEVDILGQFI